MTFKKYIYAPPAERLKIIFALCSNKRRCSSKRSILRQFRTIFNRIEKRAYRHNHNIRLKFGGLTDTQARRLYMDKPEQALDVPTISYVSFPRHVFLISNKGAVAVYARTEYKWGEVKNYADKIPVFNKFSKSGVDIFDRTESI